MTVCIICYNFLVFSSVTWITKGQERKHTVFQKCALVIMCFQVLSLCVCGLVLSCVGGGLLGNGLNLGIGVLGLWCVGIDMYALAC